MGQDQAGGALHAGVSMYFAAMHVCLACKLATLRTLWNTGSPSRRPNLAWTSSKLWRLAPICAMGKDQNRSGDQNFCGEGRWNVAQHDAKHNGVEESGGYCETSGWWRQVPMPSHRWIAQRTNAISEGCGRSSHGHCHMIYDILEYREMCCLLEFADVGKGNIRKKLPCIHWGWNDPMRRGECLFKRIVQTTQFGMPCQWNC